MSTHTTGEIGKGVYKRGQWITESCVVHKGEKGTRTPNHADKTQPVQNRKGDGPNKRQGRQRGGMRHAPPPQLVPLG